MTQYSMGYLEDLGILKMDFLGLKNLTVIDDILKEIKKRRGIDIDITTISMDPIESYFTRPSCKRR